MNTTKKPFNKSLLELAVDDQFIMGICNFCDRWCEKCIMSSKCLNYAYRQKIKGLDIDLKTEELKNREYWKKINHSFNIATKLLLSEVYNFLPKTELPKHVDNPLEILAKKYSDDVNIWLVANGEKLNEKNKHVFIQTNEKEAICFAEACEIIKWYSNFIALKIDRAHFKFGEHNTPDLNDKKNLNRDNIGSAKIAIIACNLSIGAFSALYSECGECQNDVFNFISQLSLIKKQLLQTFPNAMKFMRPGFDE